MEIKKRGKVTFNISKNRTVDERLSYCRHCGKGIFKNRHTYIWTGTGYLHEECKTDEDKISA